MNPSNAQILVVDDQLANRKLLADLLAVCGYRVLTVDSGAAALKALEDGDIDLVLLDVVMPEMDGFSVLERIRADPRRVHVPVVLCTALDPARERARGIECGADDFLQKPIDHAELMARVRSLLRVKKLFDRVSSNEALLRELNATLETRVQAGVAEVTRLSRLKRFFSPALAAKIVEGGVDDPLVGHRRDICVVFVDLRGFTAFADSSAPEDVMLVLSEFHAALGSCIDQSGGTIERFTGDGVMIFFNEPERVDNPCADAIQFAITVRERVRELAEKWASNSFSLHVGQGVAYGYATLGAIGYASRIDYGAIGSVTNLAARLCAEAGAGEIVVQQRAANLASEKYAGLPMQSLVLKGFREPVVATRLA
jgi:adenylate cyclase